MATKQVIGWKNILWLKRNSCPLFIMTCYGARECIFGKHLVTGKRTDDPMAVTMKIQPPWMWCHAVWQKCTYFRGTHYLTSSTLMTHTHTHLSKRRASPFSGMLPPPQNSILNHLTPNGHYMGRTTQLTSRCCILYIYSTNIRTEYFKHAA